MQKNGPAASPGTHVENGGEGVVGPNLYRDHARVLRVDELEEEIGPASRGRRKRNSRPTLGPPSVRNRENNEVSEAVKEKKKKEKIKFTVNGENAIDHNGFTKD